jgi:hypothetical protein
MPVFNLKFFVEGWGVAQVEGHWLSKHEALSSNLSTNALFSVEKNTVL